MSDFNSVHFLLRAVIAWVLSFGVTLLTLFGLTLGSLVLCSVWSFSFAEFICYPAGAALSFGQASISDAISIEYTYFICSIISSWLAFATFPRSAIVWGTPRRHILLSVALSTVMLTTLSLLLSKAGLVS
jgi:hypothetical protein